MSAPTSPLEKGLFKNLRYDLPAGIVVFLVALPLCLGIALASEAPLMSGLVTGVVGGLVVTVFSRSALSVSGPAAGLASIVGAGIAQMGSFESFLVAVVIAGLIQTALGVVRLGFLAEFFPLSVIKGMLAAIGIILILKQIPYALGGLVDDKKMGYAGEIVHAVQTAAPGVLLVTAAALAILILWEQPFIRDRSWSKIIPGPLVAVLASVGINEILARWFPSLAITREAKHLVDLPLIRSWADVQLHIPTPDFVNTPYDADLFILAATLAAVASIETLLCVEATDKLDPFHRVSPTNRELMAQGIGNTVAGLIGGLPMTAVIVRSSANIYSGGRTRASAWFHGALLLGLVLAVPFVLNRIPLGALAAVLLVVGYKLARVSLFKQMWTAGLDQFLPFIVTILVTVATDLLVGVTTGFIVGVFTVFLTNYKTAIVVTSTDDRVVIRLLKDVSFLNKGRLKSAFAAVPDGSKVTIEGASARFIDRDIQEAIAAFEITAPRRNIAVETRSLDTEAHPLASIAVGSNEKRASTG